MKASLLSFVAVAAFSSQAAAFLFFPLRPLVWRPYLTIKLGGGASGCPAATCPKQICPRPDCIAPIDPKTAHAAVEDCINNYGYSNVALSNDGSQHRCLP
ncbi:hypothetical protein CDD83_4447 [Cordyceps sp. RAO-2017]|nr:hypothetical protein CDD83_4447 [Cordyceps sp. RAO-2017]